MTVISRPVVQQYSCCTVQPDMLIIILKMSLKHLKTTHGSKVSKTQTPLYTSIEERKNEGLLSLAKILGGVTPTDSAISQVLE